MNSIILGLQKIIFVLESEEIPYMIVGGFAMSFYNRARFTNDIDVVVQLYPHDVPRILAHFPGWDSHEAGFQQQVSQGMLFNITDFESGVRFDFIAYQDSDYNWTAFERRKPVDFMGVLCKISTPEDLVISKLLWYNISKSEKQRFDIKFIIEEIQLNRVYLDGWIAQLFIKKHGIF
jgi:hypothetical protein